MRRPVLLCALLLLAGCGSARRDVPIAGPMRIDDARLAEGRQLFMQKCNHCHPRGESGVGPAINNKPLPGWLMRFQIRHGLGAMPHFPEHEIDDAQAKAITAYLKHMRRRG